MDSSRQHFEDKLGHLAREALNAQVGKQEPPESIWKRVVAKLEAERNVAIPIPGGVPAPSDAE